ncbi:MAG TPA: hypothetical protein VFL17_14680 [Anaerolineae bacterium]|nr:hypothetical protein [Anaerolineae bacterium]
MQRLKELLERYNTFIASTQCRHYEQIKKELLAERGFTDVPATWAHVYAEYRGMIRDLFGLYRPIFDVCDAGGGVLPNSHAVFDAIQFWLNDNRPRLDQLLGEAYQLPRP